MSKTILLAVQNILSESPRLTILQSKIVNLASPDALPQPLVLPKTL